jgi:hypothetical protein
LHIEVDLCIALIILQHIKHITDLRMMTQEAGHKVLKLEKGLPHADVI